MELNEKYIKMLATHLFELMDYPEVQADIMGFVAKRITVDEFKKRWDGIIVVKNDEQPDTSL